MVKILVTGGKGYVGGRICEYLSKAKQYEILVTSRNAKDTLQLPNVKIVAIDYQTANFEEILKGVDTVIHLAALNEIDCVKYPYQAIDVNIKNTLKWLKAAENIGVRKFIYLSTIHVYGSPLEGHITEETLTRPNHPYSITHKAAEDYVLASRGKSSMDAIVLRLSNSFGTPQTPNVDRWTLLVNDLCRSVISSQQLTLRSSGTQLRDFITLTDVAKAIYHLLQLDKIQGDNGIYNLGGNQTLSVYEMTKRIAKNYDELFGEKVKIVRATPLKERTSTLAFSVDKLINTGFTLTGKIDDELKATLLFCKKYFS